MKRNILRLTGGRIISAGTRWRCNDTVIVEHVVVNLEVSYEPVGREVAQ